MTSLAVIFVLLFVASLNNRHQEQENTVSQLSETLEEVLESFRQRGVEVQRDKNDPLVLLVIVPERLFNFAFDKADIPPQGADFLQGFMPRLVGEVCKKNLKDRIASIIVEGHADSRGADRANLDRSQQRASAVANESREVLRQTKPLGTGETLSECFKELVSAAGRGSADPVLDSAGMPDPDRSRRVIFKIRVRSDERELTQVAR